MDLLKKSRGFPMMLVFSKISQNYFCIVKVVDQIYGSRDNDWLLVYGGLAVIGRCGHFKTREVIEIARREREGGEEFVGVLTNGVDWRRSYGDGHTTALNRGGRWCSDGEMVPDVRRMSCGGCSG
jgi:hypothetical protein